MLEIQLTCRVVLELPECSRSKAQPESPHPKQPQADLPLSPDSLLFTISPNTETQKPAAVSRELYVYVSGWES